MAAPLLVTPEAVVLDITSAGIPTRMIARMLDVLVQAMLLIAFFVLAGVASSSGVSGTALLVTALFVFAFVLFGYPAVLETVWHGRTLGKAAMGLRVVTKEGAPIRFRHAVIRGGADIIDVWGLGLLAVTPGLIGVLTMFLSSEGQRLGDMAAGTIVIRERYAAKAPTSTVFAIPQGLEAYADTVDVSRLSERDYQAARSFLLRAHTLTPDARIHVAASLAPAVAAGLRHEPPWWVSPEQFLAVVVARRQQRGAIPATAVPVVDVVAPTPSMPAPSPPSSIWPSRPGSETQRQPVAAPPAPRPAPDNGFSAPR